MREYSGLWIGTVDGAFSGSISLDLQQHGDSLYGTANVYSPLYGTSMYEIAGSVRLENGSFRMVLAPKKGHPYNDPEILVTGTVLAAGQLVGEFRLSGAMLTGVITANRRDPGKTQARGEVDDGWVFDDVLRRYIRKDAAEPSAAAKNPRDWSLIKSVQSRLRDFVDAYLGIFGPGIKTQVFFLEASLQAGAWHIELSGQQERYAVFRALTARVRALRPESIAPDGDLYPQALSARLNTDHPLARTHHIVVVGRDRVEDGALLPVLFISKAAPQNLGAMSFFHAAFDRLMRHLEDMRITERTPPISSFLIRHLHEEAARSLLDKAALSAKDPASVTASLFDTINAIAALRYEKRECVASMLFVAGSDLENVCEFDSRFKTPVQVSETRKVRKLLESTTDNYHLITDGGLVHGIGRRKTAYRDDNPSVFYLEISARSTWNFYANRQFILRYESGKLLVDRRACDTRTLAASVRAHLGVSSSSGLRRIEGIIEAAARLGRGSILVFSDAAASEAVRLEHEGFMVEPFNVTPKNIALYTAIDGAVLLDADCVCHGFGVILDGMTITDKSKIRSDRGARYNSALRYVEKSAAAGGALFVVVVSDDGTVDFFPTVPSS